MSLESSIDSLYQGPADGFVAARGTLAKTLTGDDAKRVKQLPKPTAAAWAVNQVYWQARSVYDRLTQSGKKLRSAQIGALNGRATDVRGAAEQHRTVVAQAVAEAARLSSQAGLHPSTDELARTFEALSLEIARDEPAGRLSKSLQPAGFEALAGIVVKEPIQPRPLPDAGTQKDQKSEKSQRSTASEARIAKETQDRLRAEAAAERLKTAAIEKANALIVRARADEERARTELERCRRDREAAEEALARLRNG